VNLKHFLEIIFYFSFAEEIKQQKYQKRSLDIFLLRHHIDADVVFVETSAPSSLAWSVFGCFRTEKI